MRRPSYVRFSDLMEKSHHLKQTKFAIIIPKKKKKKTYHSCFHRHIHDVTTQVGHTYNGKYEKLRVEGG